MAVPVGVLNWLNVNISIENVTGLNDEGEPTYDTPAVTPCRITHKQVWLRQPTGGQLYSQTQITVLGTVTVAAEDRITMPDTTKASVIEVVDRYGPDGTIWTKEIRT